MFPCRPYMYDERETRKSGMWTHKTVLSVSITSVPWSPALSGDWCLSHRTILTIQSLVPVRLSHRCHGEGSAVSLKWKATANPELASSGRAPPTFPPIGPLPLGGTAFVLIDGVAAANKERRRRSCGSSIRSSDRRAVAIHYGRGDY
jgi:hypothetical protein